MNDILHAATKALYELTLTLQVLEVLATNDAPPVTINGAVKDVREATARLQIELDNALRRYERDNPSR